MGCRKRLIRIWRARVGREHVLLIPGSQPSFAASRFASTWV